MNTCPPDGVRYEIVCRSRVGVARSGKVVPLRRARPTLLTDVDVRVRDGDVLVLVDVRTAASPAAGRALAERIAAEIRAGTYEQPAVVD